MKPASAPAAGERAGPVASWAAPLAALGFFALGTFLRAHDVGGHELWIDEYGTTWAIAGESWRELWWRVLEIQGQSPLYYALVRACVGALGSDPLILRLPSLVSGIALLGFSYVFALRLFDDRRVAVATIAAFALDERLIFYSQDARPYALALLLATASFFFYSRLSGDERWRTRLGWILATAGAYYVHYLFGALLLVQVVHYALQRPHRLPLPRLRRDAAALGLLALLLTPGALQLAALYGRRQVLDWVPRAAGAFPGLELALEFIDPRVLGLVCAALLLALALERPRSLRLSGPRLLLLLLWIGIPLLLVALATSWLGVNLLYARYVLVIVPAVAFLYGCLAGLPRNPWLGWFVVVVFVSATAVLRVGPMLEGEGLFGSWYRDQRWRAATRALARQHREGDLVLYGTRFVELDAALRGEARPVVTDFAAWPVRAHLPRGREFRLEPLPYNYTPETEQQVLRVLESAERIWMIGLLEAVQPAIPLARRDAGLRVAKYQPYGFVHLVLLTRSSR